MTQPNDDAAFEHRLASLSEEQFDAVVARTRPHIPPPQTALERDRLAQNEKSAKLLSLRAEMTAKAYAAAGIQLPTTKTQGA